MKVIRFVLGRRAWLGVLTALLLGTLAVGVAQAHHIPGRRIAEVSPTAAPSSSTFPLTGQPSLGSGSPVAAMCARDRWSSPDWGTRSRTMASITPTRIPLRSAVRSRPEQKAQGTLSLDITLPPPIGRCRTGVVSWTATTSAPATGSAECRNALASVNAAQVQANSAQAAATSAQNAVTAAQSAADTAGAAIAAATHKIKNVRKQLKKAGTSTAKKKLKKTLKLDVKALARRQEEVRERQHATAGGCRPAARRGQPAANCRYPNADRRSPTAGRVLSRGGRHAYPNAPARLPKTRSQSDPDREEIALLR